MYCSCSMPLSIGRAIAFFRPACISEVRHSIKEYTFPLGYAYSFQRFIFRTNIHYNFLFLGSRIICFQNAMPFFFILLFTFLSFNISQPFFLGVTRLTSPFPYPIKRICFWIFWDPEATLFSFWRSRYFFCLIRFCSLLIASFEFFVASSDSSISDK